MDFGLLLLFAFGITSSSIYVANIFISAINTNQSGGDALSEGSVFWNNVEAAPILIKKNKARVAGDRAYAKIVHKSDISHNLRDQRP